MTQFSAEAADVQGLVRFGYRDLTEASFLLLSVRDARAARAWLRSADIASAVELSEAPSTAMQVALTREGLEALHLPAEVLAGFSAEFLTGMAGEENRSRRLGDTGANAPVCWQWGGAEKVPHLLVMLYAKEGLLGQWSSEVRGPLWDVAFVVLDCLPTSNLYGVEPFGFKDGVSQPRMDWDKRQAGAKQELDYRNSSAPGEFLLGYPNEYGKYTDRPLVDAGAPASEILPAAADAPGKRDLGRNGSYLVLRQLEQDVRGFWQFVDAQAGSDPDARARLAALMVGRTAEGEPLAPLSPSSIHGVPSKEASTNQFTFGDDPTGKLCPLGAHIRRANPRNADLPRGSRGLIARLVHTVGFGTGDFREDVIASTRFHRLLRRGREYGPRLSAADAIAGRGDVSEVHGIHFLCLNANISRQFEFVQGSWLMSSKFGALTEEADPLLGNRQPIPGCPNTGGFSYSNGSVQSNELKQRIDAMPQFVKVRGGAYFFLPGLSALRYIAADRT